MGCSFGHQPDNDASTSSAEKANREVEQVYRTRKDAWGDEKNGNTTTRGTDEIADADPHEIADRDVSPPTAVKPRRAEHRNLYDNPDDKCVIEIVPVF